MNAKEVLELVHRNCPELRIQYIVYLPGDLDFVTVSSFMYFFLLNDVFVTQLSSLSGGIYYLQFSMYHLIELDIVSLQRMPAILTCRERGH